MRLPKAQVTPTAILIGEIIAAKWTPEWLIGLLIGFTLFWLIVSLLTDREIVKRYPWTREWFPFLDPSGDSLSDAEMRSTYIQGKSFRIATLAEDNRIVGRTFQDCVIYGPAILIASSYTQMNDCHYKLGTKVLFWPLEFKPDETPEDDLPDGAIILEKCVFTRCTLCRIGVASPPDQIEKEMKKLSRPSGGSGNHVSGN